MIEEDKLLIGKTVEKINKTITEDIRIMEICGTHTHQIARFGIKKILSPKIRLVSGPGCPVCVTEAGYIDALIKLLNYENVVVASFGDLLRVSGSCGNLEEQITLGKKVVTVYSPEDVLNLAQRRKGENIVFAAVGFETTAPLYAALIKMARKQKINNLFLLTSLKRMEPVIRFILEKGSVNFDAMLCPGHVAAITGTAPFLPITTVYNMPAVICGFEAMDIIASISILCRQLTGEVPVQLMNTYKRCVCDAGNTLALHLINEVFQISDANWRGIGIIIDSAFTINSDFEEYDALKKFNIEIQSSPNVFLNQCDCGKVLIGEKTPDMCVNFGRKCSPEHPIGPCMVSSEGACAAYYRYGGNKV
ncbi:MULTISPECIES: hydrogenase formation protein HypD [unclassified Sedimentibacter]|uniref:hydrogenase formation protein HypD n=1 Tax=unclassified Sedimentibacter TaxID=2649220 RepID=UPI0027DFC7D5|nr:hydrogenase formation protein HypD [Sedimentibacter sp. MB35-C1]WMJ76851.1 hydrogenase formation protein HypD [Sedimentibacter sp. MB35-C1]